MVPSSFVFIDKLPLTINGKLDRRSLPAPDQANQKYKQEFAPPQNLVQEQIAVIWSQLLNVNEVGIKDNFFDLGGHSLLATQLLSRLRDIFQLDLPLRELFEHPTVAALAEAIQTARQTQQAR